MPDPGYGRGQIGRHAADDYREGDRVRLRLNDATGTVTSSTPRREAGTWVWTVDRDGGGEEHWSAALMEPAE